MTHLMTTVGSNIVIEIRATRIPMNGIERPKGVQGDLLRTAAGEQVQHKQSTLCSRVQVAQGVKGVFVFQSHGTGERSGQKDQYKACALNVIILPLGSTTLPAIIFFLYTFLPCLHTDLFYLN